jgi:hypothetical protein
MRDQLLASICARKHDSMRGSHNKSVESLLRSRCICLAELTDFRISLYYEGINCDRATSSRTRYVLMMPSTHYSFDERVDEYEHHASRNA